MQPPPPWASAVASGLPFMDEGHARFMTQLELAIEADDDELPRMWRATVERAAENFARDDAWMSTSGYAGRREHASQHRVVLDVMREGLLQAGEGRLLQVRQMARQLRAWYLKHAQTLDAALALHLRSVRFDPANAAVRGDRDDGVEAARQMRAACSGT